MRAAPAGAVRGGRGFGPGGARRGWLGWPAAGLRPGLLAGLRPARAGLKPGLRPGLPSGSRVGLRRGLRRRFSAARPGGPPGCVLLDCPLAAAPVGPGRPRFAGFAWLPGAGLAGFSGLFQKLRRLRRAGRRAAFTPAWPASHPVERAPAGEIPALHRGPQPGETLRRSAPAGEGVANPRPGGAAERGEIVIELFEVDAEPAAAARPGALVRNGAARPDSTAAHAAPNSAIPRLAAVRSESAAPARPAAARGGRGSRRGVGLRARLGCLGVHAGALRLGAALLALALGAAAPGWAQVTISVSAAPQRVEESAGPVTFSIVLGGDARDAEATINWALTGAATPGVDYMGAASGSFSVASAATGGSVVLMLIDDGEEEGDEDIVFTVSSVDGVTVPDLSGASASATIAANDVVLAPELRIAAPSTSRLAEGQVAVFSVSLRNPPAEDVTVNWQVGPDQDGDTPDAVVQQERFLIYYSDFRFDFRRRTTTTFPGGDSYKGTLTFRSALNERQKTIRIELRQDNLDTSNALEDAEEYYDVILSSPSPSGVAIPVPRATGSILAGEEELRAGWIINTSIANADQSVPSRSGETVMTRTVQEGATVDIQFSLERDSPFNMSYAPVGSLAGPRRDHIYTFCISHDESIDLNFGGFGPIAAMHAPPNLQSADIRVSGANVRAVRQGGFCEGNRGNNYTPATEVDVLIPKDMKGSDIFTIQIHVVADGEMEGAESLVFAARGVSARNTLPDEFITYGWAQVLTRVVPPTYFAISPSGGMSQRTLALAGPARASEDGGALRYTPQLSGMQFGSATQINWALSGSGSAPASAADFMAASGQFMWPANSNTAPAIVITPRGDDLNEPDEQFSLALQVAASESGAVGTSAIAATGVLEASDPISIRIADAPLAAEGGFAEFGIALAGGARSGPLLLDWAVMGAGATSAADFGDGTAADFPGSTLSVPAGMAAVVLRVPIATDSADDNGDQFTLALESAEAVGGADAEAWNNGAITLARSVATGTIGVSGGNQPPVAVGAIAIPTLVRGAAATALDVTGNFSDPDGDALTYSAVSADTAIATASIGAGGMLSVAPLAAGTVVVTVAATDPGGLATYQVISVAVRDPASIAIAAPAEAVAEGGMAEFTVSSTVAPVANLMVAYSVAATPQTDDADAAAADFGDGSSNAYPAGNVVIAANQTSTTLQLAIFDDIATEPQESFSVELGAITKSAGDAENYERGATSATGSIAPSDPARTVSISGESAAEGGAASYTVSLGEETPHIQAVTAMWAVVESTDPAHDDAEVQDFCDSAGMALAALPSGALTFAPGVTEQTIALNICDDDIPEIAEHYEVLLSGLDDGANNSASSAFSGGGETLALARSIAPSDPVLVSIGNATVVEGGTGALPLAFSGLRPAGSADFALDFEVRSSSTAVAGSGGDYTAPTSPLRISITAGSAHSIAIETHGNETPQMARTVVLRLTGLDSGLFAMAGADADASERSGTLTITDDDPVHLTIARRSGESGEVSEMDEASASFSVQRSGAMPVSNVVVQFSVSGEAAADDYDITAPAAIASEATMGSLTFLPSQSSLDITIRATNDALLEGAESLIVTLDSASGGGGEVTGVGAGAAVQISIADDERGSVSIRRDDSGAFAEGGAGGADAAVFRISIGGAELGRAAMVDFSVAGCGSGATADCTFVPEDGVLSIAPNTGNQTASATITVTARDDDLNEAAETIRVAIDGVRPAGIVNLSGTAPAVEVSLADDDAITVTIADVSADSDSTTEGVQVNEGEFAVFRVTLLGAAEGSAAEVTAPYAIGGTANADDYIDDSAGSLVIPPGGAEGRISILIRQDGISENAETLTVTLGAAPTAAAGGGSVARSSMTGEQSATVQIPMSLATPRSFAVSVAESTLDRDGVASGVQVNEGDTVTFSVSFAAGSAAPTENATVEWQIRGVEAGDTQVQGGAMSPLIFTPDNWETAQSISVLVSEDMQNEGMEELSLLLREATGDSGVSTQSAAVEISASDPISYAIDMDRTIAETAGATAAFRITLSGASAGSEGGEVRVPVIIAPASTATSPDDYSLGAMQLVFSGGDGAQDLIVTIVGDQLSEADETVLIALGAPTTGAGAGAFTAGARSSASLTILDNDALSIGIAGPVGEVAEGATAAFVVSVSGGVPAAALRVAYTLSGAGIAPGDIAAHDSLSGSFEITRAEVEAAPVGQVRLEIGIFDDTEPENAETLVITLDEVTAGAGGGTAAVSAESRTAMATISANDALGFGVARVDEDGFSEGGAGVAGSAVFRVTLSGGVPVEALSVAFRVEGAGITAGDYAVTESAAVTASAGGGTLTIQAGSATGEITIAALADQLNEAAETLRVVLQEVVGMPQAMAVIPENDPAVLSLSLVGSSNVNEGQAAIFRVSLDVASAGQVSVGWTARLNPRNTGMANTLTNHDIVASPGVEIFSDAGNMARSSTDVVIPAGLRSADFTIIPALDGLAENAEVIEMRLTAGVTRGSGSGQVMNSRPMASVTVNSSAAIARSFTASVDSSTTDRDSSASGVQVDEGDSAAFRVSLVGPSPAPTADAMITWSIGGAESSDWSGGTTGMLTFTPGDWAPKTIHISIATDTLNEGAETLTLVLSNPLGGGGVSLAEPRAAVQIRPSDPATLSIARTIPPGPSAQISEGESATFRVSLSGESEEAVSFAWSAAIDAQANSGPSNTMGNPDLSADGAVPTASGESVNGTGMIVAGQRFADIVVAAAADGVAESAEAFTVTLRDPEAAGAPVSLGAQQTAGVGIRLSSSTASVYTLTGPGGVDPSNVNEGGRAQYTITRTGMPLSTPLQITWTAAPAAGSEMNPLNPVELAEDIGTATGSVTLQSSDASVTFEVVTRSDTLNEGTEAFSVSISAAGAGVVLAGSPVTTTITDDAADEITANLSGGMAVSEGGSAILRAALSGGMSTEPVTIAYTIGADSDAATTDADAGDYTSGGNITIPAGESSGMAEIAITGDMQNEPAEVFIVTSANSDATSAGEVVVTGSPQTFTIAASDPVTLSIAPDSMRVSEGDAAGFTVTQSGMSAGDVRVAWSAAVAEQGVANPPGNLDIGAASGTALIPAGSTTAAIQVPVRFDNLNEGETPETLTVTLGTVTPGAGAGAATLAASPGQAASIMLEDVNAARRVFAAAPGNPVVEGNAINFSIMVRGAPVSEAFSVAWTLTGDAADYSGMSSGMVTFDASSQNIQTKAVSIMAAADALNEDTEIVMLALADPCAAISAAMCGFGGRPSGFPESAPALQTSTAAVSARIADNNPITATLSGGGSVAEGSPAVVSVALTGGTPTANVVLNYSANGVGADGAASGDTGGGGVFTIAPSDSAPHTFSIATVDDSLNEADESFEVTATATSAGIVTVAAPQTFTIADGDPISVRIALASADSDSVANGVQVEEGGPAVFTVTMSNASSAHVLIPYTIGGDVESTDYTDNPGSPLRIEANETTGTITIALARDADEGSEDLTVELGELASAYSAAGDIARSSSASEQRATAKIVTRSSLRTLTVTADAARLTETDADAEHSFYVTFAAGDTAFDSNTSVTWNITHGATNGTEDEDFPSGGRTGSVTIPAASTERVRFMVAVAGDDLNEAEESFAIALTAPDADTVVGPPTMFTIADDDAITYSVNISSGGAVAESAGQAVFTFALSGISEGAVMLSFTLGGTATGGESGDAARDYTNPAQMTATVMAGALSEELQVAINDDRLNEAGETIIVTLADAPGTGAGVGTATRTATPAGQSATATISDNDEITILIRAAGTEAKEGDSARFFVTAMPRDLNTGRGFNTAPVEVSYSISGEGITAADYMDETTGAVKNSSGGTISIAPMAITGGVRIRLRILSDNSAEGAEDLIVTLTAPSSPSGGMVRLDPDPLLSMAEYRIPANAQNAHTVSVRTSSTALDEPGDGPNVRAMFTLSVAGDPGSDAPRSGSATVSYSITGSATSGVDYTAPGMATVDFAESDSSMEVEIPILPDSLNEGAETIILELTGITGGSPGNIGLSSTTSARSATADISENDPVQIIVVRASENINEGESARFNVGLIGGTLSAALELPYTVTGIEPSDVSDNSASGFVAATLSGTLRIPAPSTTGRISITAVADNLNEAAESLALRVACSEPSTAGPVEFGSLECTPMDQFFSIPPSTINASDPIILSIGPPAATLSEGRDAVFPVSVGGASAGSEGAITLRYSVADFTQQNSSGANTAENPDITGGGAGGALGEQMLVIPPNTAAAEIRIPLNQDGLAEEAETFSVSLGEITPGADAGVVMASTSAAMASATIPMNEAFTRFLSVTIGGAASANVAEGESARFAVTLTGDPPEAEKPVTVTWTLSGTAVPSGQASSDHGCTSTNTLTFNAVETITLTCDIAPDNLNEAAETLIFTLSNPMSDSTGSAGIRTRTAMANIAASDPITYSISGPATALVEGATAPGDVDITADFRISLSAPSAGEITIPYEVDSSGTARGGVSGDTTRDYTTPSPQLVQISAGMMSGTISIDINDDTLNEAMETIVLGLLPESDSGFQKGAAAGVVTRVAVAESQRASARISDDAGDALILSIARASGTMVMVSEGQRAEFEVRIPTGLTRPTSTAAVCVPYTIGGAVESADYTDSTARAGSGMPCEGMLSIPAAASLGRILLDIRHDAMAESAEDLRVILGAPVSPGGGSARANPSAASATVTIPENSEFTRSLAATIGGAASMDVVEGGIAGFAVTLTGEVPEAGMPVTVTWTLGGTAAPAGDSGCMATGTLAFNALGMQSIDCTITADGMNEAAETLTFTLSNPAGGGAGGVGVSSGMGVATANIAASDPITATLSGGGSVNENANATITVTLSGGTPTANVVLAYTIGADADANTADASAADTTDSGGGSFSITPSASAPHTFSIAIADDSLNEAAEVFTVSASASSAGPVTTAASPQTFTIAASDPVTLSIAPDSVRAREGGMAGFTVTQSGMSAGDVRVAWSAAVAEQGMANPPDNLDIGVASGTALIPAGSTTAAIQVFVRFDNLDEGETDETLTVTLGAVTRAAGAGAVTLAASPEEASIMLQNVNALRTLSVRAPDAVMEGGEIVFEVALEGEAPVTAISVPWTLVQGSALGPPPSSGLGRGLARNHGGAHPDDPDFGAPAVSRGAVSGPLTGTLVFPAGALSTQSVTVPALQDPLNEGREQLRLELGPVAESAGGGGSDTIPATQVVASSATAEIAPSDPIMVGIAQTSSALADGGEAVYRVSFGCADGTSQAAGNCLPIIATTPVRVTYTFTIGSSSMSNTIILPRGSDGGEIRVPMSATTDVADVGIVDLTVNLDDAEPLDEAGDPLPPGGDPPMVNPDTTPIVTQVGEWSVELSPKSGEVFEGSAVTFSVTLGGSENLDSALEIRWAVAASGSGPAQAEPADFADESGAALADSGGFPSGSVTFAAGDAPGSTRSFRLRVHSDGVSNEAGTANEPERFRVMLMAVAAGRNVSVDTQPAEFAIPARQSAELVRRRSARIRTLVAVLDRSSAQLATDVISARLARSPGPRPWESLSVAGRELLRRAPVEDSPQSAAAAAAAGAGANGAAPADGLGLALYGAAGRAGAGGGLGATGATGGLGAGAGGAAFGGLGAGLSQHANLWQGSALPSLAELLNGSGFNAHGKVIAPHWSGVTGVMIWGAGGAAHLEGAPLRGGRTLSYEGENYSGFFGVESMLGSSMLMGVALGYSGGELDFNESAAATDPNDIALRGTIENERLSVHPYWGWWLAPELQTWLVLGWGTGETEIEEIEGAADAATTRRAEGDSTMWMASMGATGNVHMGVLDLALRFKATRVHSELDAASFMDIAAGAPLPKLRMRSLRVGGEAEFSSLFSLAGDLRLRPFASARVHLDAGSDVSREESEDRETEDRETAFDLGGGLEVTWPSRGLDMRLEGTTQVNHTGHEERRLSLDLGYDRGADARGFTFALRSALAAQHAAEWLADAEQAGLGALGGGLDSAAGGLDAAQRSLSGELAYGAAMQQFGRPGLLTPYAAFSMGPAQRRYATGLRFEAPGGLNIRLEGATESAAPAQNYELRLNINLPF